MSYNHLFKSILSTVLMISFMLAAIYVSAAATPVYTALCILTVASLAWTMYEWYEVLNSLMYLSNHH